MNTQNNLTTKIKPWQIIAALFIFAFSIRFFTTMLFVSYFDMHIYIDWAKTSAVDFFGAYKNIEGLDYPPLYLFFLAPIGWLYNNIPAMSAFEPYTMMLIKFFPVLFDSLCVVLIYQIVKKQSTELALIGAALWAIHPAFFFNSAFWGQTDSMLAFVLLLSIALLEKDRPVLGTVVYALAVLLKPQAIYFGSVVLLELLFHCKPKKILQSIGAAAGTYMGVFLPFMIGAKNPWIFFSVFLEGLDEFPFINLMSFNLWGVFRLSFVEDSTAILGGFTFSHLGYIMLALSLGFLVFMYLKSKRFSPWLAGFLFMQCVFMLSMRQHERYQILVLPFLLMVWLRTMRKEFFFMFASISVISLFNHFWVLAGWVNPEGHPWLRAHGYILTAGSLINLAVFVWSVVAVVRYSFEEAAESPEESPRRPDGI